MAKQLSLHIIVLCLLAAALPAVYGSLGASPVTFTGTIENMNPTTLDWKLHDSNLQPQASATIATDTQPARYMLTLTFHETFETTNISISVTDGKDTINKTFSDVREWETIHANFTAEQSDPSDEGSAPSRKVTTPSTEENIQKVRESLRQARLKNLSYFEEHYNLTAQNTSKQAYRAEPQRLSSYTNELTYRPQARSVLVTVLIITSIAMAGYYAHLLGTEQKK